METRFSDTDCFPYKMRSVLSTPIHVLETGFFSFSRLSFFDGSVNSVLSTQHSRGFVAQWGRKRNGDDIKSKEAWHHVRLWLTHSQFVPLSNFDLSASDHTLFITLYILSQENMKTNMNKEMSENDAYIIKINHVSLFFDQACHVLHRAVSQKHFGTTDKYIDDDDPI